MYVFISASQEDVSSPINKANHLNLGFALRNMYGKDAVTPCAGQYKGAKELSYRVSIDRWQQLHDLEMLAFIYRQESILLVRDSRLAILRYTGAHDIVERATGGLGRIRTLGYWTKVPPYIASTHEAWSKVDGEYFVTYPEKEAD